MDSYGISELVLIARLLPESESYVCRDSLKLLRQKIAPGRLIT